MAPLHIAATFSYYRIVGLLIDNSADLFVRDIFDKTPFSSVTNNLLMIKLLKKAEIAYVRNLFEKKI